MRYHLSKQSQNGKLGGLAASTSSRLTCPNSCPLKGKGCYVVGPIGWHWDAVTRWERGVTFEEFLILIKNLPEGEAWRHNQAGDLPGENEKIEPQMLAQLVDANKGRNGYTYTHKPVLDSQLGPVAENREAIAAANRNGFTINLSANGLRHADQLAALNIGPIATILPPGVESNTVTPSGRKVVVCPAQTRKDVTCATCKLCTRANRSAIVGFIPHGSGRRLAGVVAQKDTGEG